MAVNNFFQYSWKGSTSVGMSGCGRVQQDAGTAYASAAI